MAFFRSFKMTQTFTLWGKGQPIFGDHWTDELDRELESSLNPQAGKPALRNADNYESRFALEQAGRGLPGKFLAFGENFGA